MIENTILEGVKIITPKVFTDERGFFLESYSRKTFERLGIPEFFIQDNHSHSIQGVLRGLHFQNEHPQGKLVRCVVGEIFDVAVDIRKGSPTFGKWVGVNLSSDNHKMLWIPSGLAHGFYVVSKEADVLYKTTAAYCSDCECTLQWNSLNIDWPITKEPLLSKKDQKGLKLEDI